MFAKRNDAYKILYFHHQSYKILNECSRFTGFKRSMMAYLSLHSGARSYELVGDSMLKRLYRFYNRGNIGMEIAALNSVQDVLCY
jgi:hypothetical protein